MKYICMYEIQKVVEIPFLKCFSFIFKVEYKSYKFSRRLIINLFRMHCFVVI